MRWLSEYIKAAEFPLTERGTLLARHADPDRLRDEDLFTAWRYSDPAFESYYRTQSPKQTLRYEAGSHVLMFIKAPVRLLTNRRPPTIADEKDVTLFIGAWEVVGEARACERGDRDELLDVDAERDGSIHYEPDAFRQVDVMGQYIGRLVIDWPRDKRQAWRQWAVRQDKEVIAILDEPEGPFLPRRKRS